MTEIFVYHGTPAGKDYWEGIERLGERGYKIVGYDWFPDAGVVVVRCTQDQAEQRLGRKGEKQ